MFSIDGVNYDNVVRVTGLKQKFTILSGKNSKRLMDGKMYIEPLGTYINYEMTVEKRNSASNRQWDEFTNVLMNPDQKHTVTLPHFQRLQTFDMYISDGSRDLIQTNLSGTNSRWGDLTIEFVSMDKIQWSRTAYI